MKTVILMMCLLSQFSFAQQELIETEIAEPIALEATVSPLVEATMQDQYFYNAIKNTYSTNFQLNQKTFSAKIEISKDFDNIAMDKVTSLNEADLELLISEFKARVKVTIFRPATSTQLMTCTFLDVKPDTNYNLILESNLCNIKFVVSIKSDRVLSANTEADLRLLESILNGETTEANRLFVQASSKVNSAKYDFLVSK